jgi:membrane-bound lytic murein transglycosylase D
VKKGDSLSGIASRYKTSVSAIMALNGLKKSKYLKVGWKLKIPTKRGRVFVSTAAPVVVMKPEEKPVEYEVKKGDSLWTIANQYKTTTKAIMSLNRLRSPDLSIGQVLMISPGLSTFKPSSTTSYRVRKGDSPYLIAKKHGMLLSDFLKLNKITPRSTIYPGQKMMVTSR